MMLFNRTLGLGAFLGGVLLAAVKKEAVQYCIYFIILSVHLVL